MKQPLTEQLSHIGLLVIVCLLPWQTRWIGPSPWGSTSMSEFGQISLYATQCLLAVVFLLRGPVLLSPRVQFVAKSVWVGLLVLGLTFVSGMSRIAGIAQLIHVLFVILLFFVLLDRRTRWVPVVTAFVLGLIGPSLLGWWQVFQGSSGASVWLGLAAKEAHTLGVAVVETAGGRWLRAYGSFPHPNVFGGMLSLGLLGLVWVRGCWTSRVAQRAGLILAGFLSATLVVTFSRSAWVGFVIGLLVIGFRLLRETKIQQKERGLTLGVMLCVLLATGGVFASHVFARTFVQGRIEDQSVSERVSQYGEWMDVWSTSPVTGVGPGGYAVALAEVVPGKSVWSYQPVHNTYALFVAELGVMGMIAVCVVLWSWIKAFRTRAVWTKEWTGVAMLACLLVIGLFDHYLWSLWSGLVLVAFSLAFFLRAKPPSAYFT